MLGLRSCRRIAKSGHYRASFELHGAEVAAGVLPGEELLAVQVLVGLLVDLVGIDEGAAVFNELADLVARVLRLALRVFGLLGNRGGVAVAGCDDFGLQ